MRRKAYASRTCTRRVLGWLIPLVWAAMLAGCFSASEPVPHGTLAQLTGKWVDAGGHGYLRFYPDATVKIMLSDRRPPLKALSRLEKLKDGKIAFAIGDSWSRPVYVELAADGKSLVLRQEGKDGWQQRFIRQPTDG